MRGIDGLDLDPGDYTVAVSELVTEWAASVDVDPGIVNTWESHGGPEEGPSLVDRDEFHAFSVLRSGEGVVLEVVQRLGEFEGVGSTGSGGSTFTFRRPGDETLVRVDTGKSAGGRLRADASRIFDRKRYTVTDVDEARPVVLVEKSRRPFGSWRLVEPDGTVVGTATPERSPRKVLKGREGYLLSTSEGEDAAVITRDDWQGEVSLQSPAETGVWVGRSSIPVGVCLVSAFCIVRTAMGDVVGVGGG